MTAGASSDVRGSVPCGTLNSASATYRSLVASSVAMVTAATSRNSIATKLFKKTRLAASCLQRERALAVPNAIPLWSKYLPYEASPQRCLARHPPTLPLENVRHAAGEIPSPFI